jgi:hypothetical protein
LPLHASETCPESTCCNTACPCSHSCMCCAVLLAENYGLFINEPMKHTGGYQITASSNAQFHVWVPPEAIMQVRRYRSVPYLFHAYNISSV